MGEQIASEMFWIVQGEVSVSQRDVPVGALRTGDWFGELALFFPKAVRTATIRCETYCEFVVLHREKFQRNIVLFPKVQSDYEKLAEDLRVGNAGALRGN